MEQTKNLPVEARNSYEQAYEYYRLDRLRNETGRVILREEDRPWEEHQQGKQKLYLLPFLEDTALNTWIVFKHEIREKSGRHTHQGGLVIYVLEGEGYTEVNGKRMDWKEGDLLLLPVVPGGVEHQHFNTRADGTPSLWLAFIYIPFVRAFGSQMQHVEVSPYFPAE